MKSLFGTPPSHEPGELMNLERSTTPTAAMNLLMRFETLNGPRTVIACSVPLQTAREVAEAMIQAGHHAECVDRCTALSVADHLMMKKLEQLPDGAELPARRALDAPRRAARRRTRVPSPMQIAAE